MVGKNHSEEVRGFKFYSVMGWWVDDCLVSWMDDFRLDSFLEVWNLEYL